MGDMEAYAQSKLAITAWSRYLANELTNGPSVISVNPGSLLATKMVKEGFGIEGKDLNIGADILVRLVTDPVDSQRTGDILIMMLETLDLRILSWLMTPFVVV